MSLEENRKKFLQQYGGIDVRFSHYFLHTFWYEGEATNDRGCTRILVGIGGDPDSIYKRCVVNNEIYTILDLDPIIGIATGDWSDATILEFNVQ